MLGSVLPVRRRIVYKRAPTLRDKIAPGVVDPPIFKKHAIYFYHWFFMRVGDV